MADIFLSHSSADNDAADQIKSRLEHDRESWSVFLDKHPHDGILAGQGWQDRLRSELQSCRLVLAIITPDWLASRWCFTEAVTATFRGKDFIGVQPGDLPDGAFDVAPPIVHERQRQQLDLATGAGWEELLHALDRSGLDPSHWFSIPEGVGPYPGFVAFEEKDAGVFFGRDQEITEYLDALNLLKASDRAQALVISGSSGSGKSSLLKAGLIPRLRQHPDWLIIPPFDLSREPIHALILALRAAAQVTGANIDLPLKPPQTVEDLTKYLHDSLRVIEEKANAWLLLPLDQVEVLLASSQEGGETDASRLLSAVGQLLATRTRKLVAVLTLRTEFLPTLERVLPGEVRLNERSLHSITALSEIIEKPAARFGIELEKGLTGRMVEDTCGADALPLLAYTLRELNDNYGDDKHLTVAEYEQLGGVEGAIEKKLHQAFSDPKPTSEEYAAFRRAFVRHFVRVDESAVEGERYLRTVVARNVLPDCASRLVDRLREARLLVSGADGMISIAHERLIRDWTDVPLQTWLVEDRDDRKLIDNLNSLLAAHRDGGPLLSKKPLLDGKDFLERDRALKKDELELAQFIEDSDSAEQSRLYRQKWKFRGTAASSLVFLGVAIGAVWFFLEAQEQARTALTTQSRFLADLAKRELDKGFADRALLLALNAWPGKYGGTRPSIVGVSEQLMRASLINTKQAVFHLDGLGRRPTFNLDGRRVLIVTNNGNANLWSLETGERLQTFLHDQPINHATFSPDGRQVLTSSRDNTAALWSVKTGERLQSFEHKKQVMHATFSPDGRQVLTSSRDDTAALWSVETGERLQTFEHEQEVMHATFSPDGRQVLTSSWDNAAVLWSVETGEWLQNFEHQRGVIHVAFSPDGHRVLTVTKYGNATLWSVETDEQLQTDGRLQTFKHLNSSVAHATFSPDGRQVLTSSRDDTAALWSVETGERLHAFEAKAGVRHATFSPDGRRVLTITKDGNAVLWSVETGERLRTFKHEQNVIHATYSPDGQQVLTTSGDGIYILWSLGACRTWHLFASRQWHPVKNHALFLGHEENLRLFSDGKSAPINFSSPQSMHSFQIPSNADQTPFTLD